MGHSCIGEKIDSEEAKGRAEAKMVDPKIRAWMRRARRLMADLPPEVWIYWEENHLNLMAKSPEGLNYVNRRGGSDQAAVIDSFQVPESDCGGW